ncbi:MAG TPA: preprotein translocase subunit SecG [Soehngenia sp.]|jgi:protein translocase, SecG subunit|nr:preprotein translocase subunit SecG [Soehngenia sp.]
MATFFAVLMLISSIVLIVSILMQESKQEGLGSIGGGTADSIFGKSIGTSKQALLRKITIVASVVFMISALALAI